MEELLTQVKATHNFSQLSQSEKRKAVRLEKNISSKNLQVRSYESIVEPRVNWLLDLDLIDSKKHCQDILVLSAQGEIFLESVKNVYDIGTFIENDYVKTYCATYKINPKSETIIEKRIEKYLNFAFINFKTLAPKRINASQAFNYISVMCLLRDGIVAEYKDIKNYIFTKDGKGFTIDWFPSENDGSIKMTK